MEITEVRIKLMEEAGERLQAFCSITFDDCFVVRDLKIIDGPNGPFVAMPSRKLTAHCSHCSAKNHLRAAHCNQCGARLEDHLVSKDDDGRAKLYADIAHPINSACREMIQTKVIDAFRDEVEQSKQPGYVPSYDDFEDDLAPTRPRHAPRPRRPAAPHAEPRRAEAAPVAARAMEHAKIQPAESEPRAPHKAIVTRVAAGAMQKEPPSQPAKRGDFGAGIF